VQLEVAEAKEVARRPVLQTFETRPYQTVFVDFALLHGLTIYVPKHGESGEARKDSLHTEDMTTDMREMRQIREAMQVLAPKRLGIWSSIPEASGDLNLVENIGNGLEAEVNPNVLGVDSPIGT
jgi:hypothetical protein